MDEIKIIAAILTAGRMKDGVPLDAKEAVKHYVETLRELSSAAFKIDEARNTTVVA